MKISMQNIDFPADCEVINHVFSDYEPSVSHNLVDSVIYLSEDLLQCAYPADDLIIDLGWYGDIKSGKGEFRILIIKNENWEIPSNTIHSKSALEVKDLINKILAYYTRTRD